MTKSEPGVLATVPLSLEARCKPVAKGERSTGAVETGSG